MQYATLMVKKKTHMISSIDAEKVSDIIQNAVMILKNTPKTRSRRDHPQHDKRYL